MLPNVLTSITSCINSGTIEQQIYNNYFRRFLYLHAHLQFKTIKFGVRSYCTPA